MKLVSLITIFGTFYFFGDQNILAANQANNSVKLQTPPAPVANKTTAPPVAVDKAGAPIGSFVRSQIQDQFILQSRDISSFGPKWQSFSDYLTVPKGYEQLPLYLSFTNGVGGNKFQDLRILLAGKPIATLKDFNGQASLIRSLANLIGPGDTLLTVQAYGPAGAKFTWKFSTPKLAVTRVFPLSFAPTDKVLVEGRNFPDKPNIMQILIDDKPATIISSKNNSLQMKPPTGLLGGKANLIAVMGPQKSTPVQVTIKGAPEVQSVNMISTAPGQPLTITGKGFSPMTAENQVMIGPYAAEVTSASPTSIECIVPLALDSMNPAWGVPIKVKTNGMESTTTDGKPVTINIQLRVF